MPKNFEPVRRMAAGKFGWVKHRFPIKGGITAYEVRAREATEELVLNWQEASVLERICTNTAAKPVYIRVKREDTWTSTP